MIFLVMTMYLFWVGLFSNGPPFPVVLFFMLYGSYPIPIFVSGLPELTFQSLTSYGDNHLCGDLVSFDTCTTYLTHPSLHLPWGQRAREWPWCGRRLGGFSLSLCLVGVKCFNGLLADLNATFSQTGIVFCFFAGWIL